MHSKEIEEVETSCDKTQLLLDIKMTVPIMRVIQEDRDCMVWKGQPCDSHGKLSNIRGREDGHR